MALAVPLVFLLVVGVMHHVARKPGGSGTYRAQCYTAQLIGLPLLLAILAVAFVLDLHPTTGSQPMAYGLVVLAVVLYGFILHMCSVMAVQQLRAGKAMLVVLVGLVLVVVLIVIAAAILESTSGDSNSSHSGGDGSSHNGGNSDSIDADAGGLGRRSPGIALLCPNCGLHRSVPMVQAQLSGFCPRCGAPITRI